MKKIIGLICILAGAWFLYTGHHQADSLVGRTRTTITEFKNDIDGKNRVARPYWYYGGGALLILGGAALALCNKRT